MGEQEDAMTPQETGSEHDIGAPLANQLDEFRILLRRVFEVRVLDDHEVASDDGKTPPQRCTLSTVAGLSKQHESQLALQFLEDRARTVRRAIVDHDELDAHVDGEHAPDDFVDRVTLVVDRHHHREKRVGCNESRRSCQRRPRDHIRDCCEPVRCHDPTPTVT